MTRQQVHKIAEHRAIPQRERVVEIVETFISWIMICEKCTYKIKRPVQLSYLDFSSIERRKNFCLQEYYLNRQLASDMYLDVMPVTLSNRLRVGGDGEVIDYAVRMKTMDNKRLMNNLLQHSSVTSKQIDDLAECIANFHETSNVIYSRANYDLTEKFNDISEQSQFFSDYLGRQTVALINDSIDTFHRLIMKFTPRLIRRVKIGFFRDCHGDLHSGNVFLMNRPIPFDRIDFDYELCEIDVLNEIAFMCMDLEYYNQPDLSQQFFETYNMIFPAVLSKEDEHLFLLYKAYRANVCAKVNALKAQSSSDESQRLNFLNEARRYLNIMGIYLNEVDQRSVNEVGRPVFSSFEFEQMIL